MGNAGAESLDEAEEEAAGAQQVGAVTVEVGAQGPQFGVEPLGAAADPVRGPEALRWTCR